MNSLVMGQIKDMVVVKNILPSAWLLISLIVMVLVNLDRIWISTQSYGPDWYKNKNILLNYEQNLLKIIVKINIFI